MRSSLLDNDTLWLVVFVILIIVALVIAALLQPGW